MSGVIGKIQPIRDYKYSKMNTVTNYTDKEYILPYYGDDIKNQGSIGACVSCALTTVLEGFYKQSFSEGWCHGSLREDDEKKDGMIWNRALNLLCDLGGVPKSLFDILEPMPEMKNIVSKFPELKEDAKKWRPSGYLSIHSGDKSTGGRKDNEIKDALKRYQIPLFAMSPDYFGESHAICIIGWDDINNKYIIKNSWGETYGDKGIKKIPKTAISHVYVLLFEPIELPFKDVKTTDWFYPYVKTAYLSGVVNGKSSEMFSPLDTLTRAEAAVLVSNILEKIDERFDTLNKLLEFKIDK